MGCCHLAGCVGRRGCFFKNRVGNEQVLWSPLNQLYLIGFSLKAHGININFATGHRSLQEKIKVKLNSGKKENERVHEENQMGKK